MGMAASQARYLALVARKSNCEYEGQQINEARTALSNQSANLFNQMLGLNVPVPPSTQDFTTTQYSYTDGINASTISSWQQLSDTDPNYNYVVTHYYYIDRYTGSMKMLTDPQVQFSGTNAATSNDIQTALEKIETTYAAYLAAKEAREDIEKEMTKLGNYADTTSLIAISAAAYDGSTDIYSFDNGGTTYSYINYNDTSLSATDKSEIDTLITELVNNGALDASYLTDKSNIYYDATNKNIAFEDDLKILNGIGSGTMTTLPIYETNNAALNGYKTTLATAKVTENAALINYNNAVKDYDNLEHPTYIGNCELTPLSKLDKDQEAEINQVRADLIEQGIDANILDCFDANGDYIGGIYSFKLNGVTYYTTYDDLQSSYAQGQGNNNIDGQPKMAYYNATYISTKIEETEKALLETDGNGRFVSVKFENDTVTYTLNMETVTDDIAYQDAMNQYYYDNATYDKMVQDINAKTSIIQQQDQQLELRLKQLDTEQKALSTEMDAVKKVVDDNVEKSFKTFGG